MSKEKKKKEKTSVTLPKAWQSVKHRNEMAQTRNNFEDTWKAIGTIIAILLILFVILGGVSQRKIFNFVFDWSKNVGEAVSNWFEGGSIITNEDGIYWDPTGENGEPIVDTPEDNGETSSGEETSNEEESVSDTNNEETVENQSDEVQNE